MKSPFRSIRQTLFNEGKLLRYLGYAIGEIALIMVGILLSLKLYDMNEDRKAQVDFDAYVVQLREDVKEAIDLVDRAIRSTEKRVSDQAYVLKLLQVDEYETAQLEALKNGLQSMGKYPEIQIHVGLLGELLDGDKEVISRDSALVRQAMKMEGSVERSLGFLNHIYNKLDLTSVQLVKFRGHEEPGLKEKKGTVLVFKCF